MSACCRIRLFLLAFCALTAGGFAQKGIITTFVGPGIPVDGAGALAQDFGPSAIAPDGAGGFYVSSYTRNQIYRVAADGTLKVIAGTGSAGFSGDNGPAVHASLNAPWGLAADAAGNIYFADSYNHRVRRITPEGLITTIAGDGTADSGGDGGPAASAHLYYPVEVAIAGSGTLYITDNSHRVRKLTPAGIISAVAGTGVAGYNGDGGAAAAVQLHYPRALALDSAGNLYIADMLNHRIRMVAADGTISTLAGTGVAGYSGNGGPATSAQLHSPRGNYGTRLPQVRFTSRTHRTIGSARSQPMGSFILLPATEPAAMNRPPALLHQHGCWQEISVPVLTVTSTSSTVKSSAR